jgi:acetyl esterase
MNLDPGIERYIDEVTSLERGSPANPSLAQQRAGYLARCRHFDPARPAGIRVEDDVVPRDGGAVPVRWYRPEGAAPLPVVIYFHGGGWVVGNLDSHDTITAELAARTGALVVAVDYRLAPEHPYPAAFHDGRAVLHHVTDPGKVPGADPTRIVVAGDSAGGNLAAALSLWARDSGGPPLRGQALIYPVLDPDLTHPSCRTNANAPLLTTAGMRWFWQAYLGGALSTDDSYAAPARSRNLTDLPPAFITTADHDPLSDEGHVYARRLREAGVGVEHRAAARLVHGHLRARHLSADAAQEFDALAAALRRMLS